MTAGSPRLDRALRLAIARHSGDPHVTGIDYGYAYRGGRRTDQMAIRVHVDAKKPLSGCKAIEIVQPEISGLPTDVVARRYRFSGESPAAVASSTTLRPGLSVGNPAARAGTIGLIVYDGANPTLLSCHHVLAGPLGEVGQAVLHPPVEQGGSGEEYVVGHLSRAHTPGLWGDAAIARLNDGVAFSRAVHISGAVVRFTAMASPGLVLEKVGATSGVTRGLVEAVGQYRIDPSGAVIDGMLIAPLDATDVSLPGDSGAIWYDGATDTGYGLHTARGKDDDGRTFAIASHLPTVLDTLDVTLEPA